MSDIIKIKEEYLLKLKDDLDLNNINQIKSELFGKTGKISNEFKKMGSMSPDSRKKFASELNAIKDELQEVIEKKIKDIEISTGKSAGAVRILLSGIFSFNDS